MLKSPKSKTIDISVEIPRTLHYSYDTHNCLEQSIKETIREIEKELEEIEKEEERQKEEGYEY